MSYMGTHDKIRATRGSARNFICPCGEQAHEWAYNNSPVDEQVDAQGRRYSRNLDDYDALCFRCHRLRDKEAITHCPQGHAYQGQNLILDGGKRKCRTCVYARNRRRLAERGLTPEQRNRKTQLQRERRAKARGRAA